MTQCENWCNTGSHIFFLRQRAEEGGGVATDFDIRSANYILVNEMVNVALGRRIVGSQEELLERTLNETNTFRTVHGLGNRLG